MKVSKNQKQRLVQNIFTEVVKKYDLMNNLMSFGTHLLWKKRLIQIMNIQSGSHVIDVGAGTGDIEAYLKDINVSITAVDLNFDMLKQGRENIKNKKNKINWINCNAEALPFKNNTFDKYVTSFCLRNVALIDRALTESLRILKPGGSFYCMEFSAPQSSLISNTYNFYKTNIIPFMGQQVTNNRRAYKYLSESITLFPHQDILLSKLNKLGFGNTSVINLFNGIVSIHIGYKI